MTTTNNAVNNTANKQEEFKVGTHVWISNKFHPFKFEHAQIINIALDGFWQVWLTKTKKYCTIHQSDLGIIEGQMQ